MRRRDLVLLAVLAAVLAALFSPILLRPGHVYGNFGDIYMYHYPLRHLVTATLESGRLPLWNPWIFAGVPLAANSQALAFYPLSALHYILPLSTALTLDAAFHLALAGLGAYLLLRAWKVSRGGAFTLATAFALSPFLVCRLPQGVPTHLTALAWCPWVWLAAEHGGPLLLGAVWALQVLSGHPQFGIINGAGLGFWMLLREPRRLPRLAAGAAIALALSAAQVLPTAEYLKQSVRAFWDPSLALGYSLEPRFLATLLLPEAFGDPRTGNFALMPSEFFEMFLGYIGLAALAFALAGLRALRGRTLAAILGLAAAGVFFALGANNPGYLELQRWLRLDFLRVPARFSFLVLWAIWLAAAAGWAARGRRLSAGLQAALALFTLGDLGWRAARWVYAEDPAGFIAPMRESAALLRRGDRMATSPDVPAANKAMLYRIRNATGYEAFYPAPIAFYTARSEKGPAADGSRTYITDWLTPEMSRLSVRWYVTPEKIACETPALRSDGGNIYENPEALPLVRGAAEWVERSAEAWTFKTDGRPVVVSQAHYPGWKAWTSEGTPLAVQLADGLFPVLSPSGAAVIHFRFLPWTVAAGVLLSILALAAAAAELARRGAWTY